MEMEDDELLDEKIEVIKENEVITVTSNQRDKAQQPMNALSASTYQTMRVSRVHNKSCCKF